MKFSTIDIAVIATAALLAIGVFLPLTSLPIIGDVSYNRIADIESYIVIAFCVAAIGMIVAKQSKFVIGAAVGIWVTLLFPAIRGAMKSDDGGLLSRATKQATGAMQDFAADLFMNVADFSWGGFVFLVALISFTVACVIRTIK